MKTLIRYKVFETNSSSEHSLTLDKEDEIRSLIDSIEDSIYELDYIDEAYAVLGKIKRLEVLFLEEINKMKEDE